MQGTTLRIVDPVTRVERRDAEVGEVWVRGEGVAQRYVGDAARSKATFDSRLASAATSGAPLDAAAYLRTGDLGYVRNGELFVVGRAKDVVIVRGMNLHAGDLELTAEAAHAAVRSGCVAVFPWHADDEEGPGIVAEIGQHDAEDLATIGDAIRIAIARTHRVEVVELALVRHGLVPKTSSGKLMRRACRDALLAGTIATRWRWSAPSALGGHRVEVRAGGPPHGIWARSTKTLPVEGSLTTK